MRVPGLTFELPAVPLLEMVSVTGTEIVVPPPAMVTALWYVVAFSPEVFTERVRVAGVVPAVGLTINQLAPAEAVKLVPKIPARLIFWAAGMVPPNVCEKETEEGEAVIVGFAALDSVNVIGIVTGVAPPVIATEV